MSHEKVTYGTFTQDQILHLAGQLTIAACACGNGEKNAAAARIFALETFEHFHHELQTAQKQNMRPVIEGGDWS